MKTFSSHFVSDDRSSGLALMSNEGISLSILGYDASVSPKKNQDTPADCHISDQLLRVKLVSSELFLKATFDQLAHSISNCCSKILLIGFSTLFQSVKLSVTIYWQLLKVLHVHRQRLQHKLIFLMHLLCCLNGTIFMSARLFMTYFAQNGLGMIIYIPT